MRDRKRTQRLWGRRIAAQQASGLSVTEFCRRERIQKSGFYYWKRRVPRKPSEGFVELKIASATSRVVHAEVAAIELCLGNGRRLMVPAGFDRDHLLRLIGAIEALA
jgi:hypothetical protein